MANDKSITALASVRANDPMASMIKRIIVKQLYLAFRDRQATESDVEEIVDGIIGLAVIAGSRVPKATIQDEEPE